MAQEPLSPWSRWDPEGFQFIPATTSTLPPSLTAPRQLINNRQFDAPVNGGVNNGVVNTVLRAAQGTLQDQSINQNDTTLVNCYYGFNNLPERALITCYQELGCCERGCCVDGSWGTKYGWAVALICIFSFFVILAGVIWFVLWLVNRSKDKQLRAEIENDQQQQQLQQQQQQQYSASGQGQMPTHMASPYSSQNLPSPLLNQPYYDGGPTAGPNHPGPNYYHHDGMAEPKYYDY
uniref:CX domain-containing protein n=1 Tax=Rhabditophanes sp. KR3021 TaxID=114890 RepID=A0AC35TZ79_9BILA